MSPALQRCLLTLVVLCTAGCRRLPYDEVELSFAERTPTSFAVAIGWPGRGWPYSMISPPLCALL